MGYAEDEFCNKSLEHATNCSVEYERWAETSGLKPEAVAVPLTFALIFVVGVTGNVLLTLNFARHKKLSTPHNALVVNLAGGDLLMLVIGLPFNSVWYTVPYWPFGELICKLSRFAETAATAVTIATLTALSVERYLIVTGRRRQQSLSSSLPLVVVSVVWAMGLVLSLPDLLSASVHTAKDNRTGEEREFCLDYNPTWGHSYPMVNVMCRFLVLFLLPLMVIAPCYIALAFHLFFKMFDVRGTPTSKTPLRATAASSAVRPEEGFEATHDNGASTQDNQARVQIMEPGQSETTSSTAYSNNFSATPTTTPRKTPSRKRRRLAVTVLGLVTAFIACWLPRHIFLLWFYFDPGLYNNFWHVFKITGFCLMFANSAVNPFVFYVLDLHFRTFVNSVLCCRRIGRSPSNGEVTGAAQDTTAVEMSATEDRKTCIAMAEMPAAGERIDAV
ncbi:hypothetical protein BaRGS_00011425 [Batillaria attramentaria]|uniref:G-protein coupled receptors family 1 profile domain-containing protein n=1 Tax=Batillaria attramentaria TaxID=370345 RepID=A0ABD0LD13_9CAEN